MALMISVMAMATEEAYVCIRLTSPSGTSSVVRLTQDDARTAAYESGYDSQKMMYQANSKSVLLYGFVGSEKCEDIVTNQLPGVKLGFVTNNVDANGYSLKFENVSGIALKLYDAVEHQIIDIVNNDEYVFNATVGQVDVENRFSIYAPFAVTLNNSYLATFSADENVVIPAGLTAYEAKYQSMTEVLSLNPIANYIPKNTGVILYNEAQDNKEFLLEIYTGTDDMPEITLNDLKPASAWESHTGTIYVLSGSSLYLYEDQGDGMKPNKAYLELPVSVTAPKRIALHFNEEQGVENIAAEGKAVKFIENGRVFIKRDDKVYNLQGQLVK